MSFSKPKIYLIHAFIIILDACHSGISAARGKSFVDCITESMSCVFSACKRNQCSYSLEELEQGIFTYSLCNQLRKFEPMTDVYIEQIKIPVCDEVKEIAEKNGFEQIPTLIMKSIGNIPMAKRNNNLIEEENLLIQNNKQELVEFKDVMEIISPDKITNSPNGVTLPKKVNMPDLFGLIQNVKKTEIFKIQKYYCDDDFETSAEKVWTRAILVLKNRILALGQEFVADMLGINDYSFIADLPPYNCIVLAYELGFINDLGKMQLLISNDYINYYLKPNAEEELPQDEANIIILFIVLEERILSISSTLIAVEDMSVLSVSGNIRYASFSCTMP